MRRAPGTSAPQGRDPPGALPRDTIDASTIASGASARIDSAESRGYAACAPAATLTPPAASTSASPKVPGPAAIVGS